jgi:hypothetical protein
MPTYRTLTSLWYLSLKLPGVTSCDSSIDLWQYHANQALETSERRNQIKHVSPGMGWLIPQKGSSLIVMPLELNWPEFVISVALR